MSVRKNSTARRNSLTTSVGVGLRQPYYDLFLKQVPPRSVSWVEVVSENYFKPRCLTGAQSHQGLKTLLKVRERLPVALHGVSMSLGSADGVRPGYLKELKSLVDQVEPLWVSDHLCWTGVGGQNSHDLLPLPYTTATLRAVSDQIHRVQNILGRQILIENPSQYFSLDRTLAHSWDEAAFLAELVKRSGAGLLLDINNVYVTSVNNGGDPWSYLTQLPASAVQQVHLAGHSQHISSPLLVDTHDALVCEDVWALYERYIAATVEEVGVLPTMIERDDEFPHWSELEAELQRIHQIQSPYSESMSQKNEVPLKQNRTETLAANVS